MAPKANDIKERISNAARNEFFQFGYTKVTVDEIAKAAGVSKKTIYHHFPSKEMILKDVMNCKRQEWHEMIDRIYEEDIDFLEKMKKIGYQIANELSNAPLTFFLDLERNAPHLMKKAKEIRRNNITKGFEKFYKEGMEAHYFRSDIPLDVVSEMYYAMMNHLFVMATDSKNNYSIKELYDHFSRMIFEGVFTREGFKKYIRIEDENN